MKQPIPVYIFTGFLEGGKTHMIQESLEDQRFNSGEKTMLICCEEGIDDYEPSRFWGKNVYIEHIENEEDVTLDTLNSIATKHIIDRIIIEYNGMWKLETLFMNMPENWDVYQIVMSADCATFELYNANMRALMFDKLAMCEMVVLNRATEDADRESIHKIVRGVNPRAEIVYDFPDGRIEYDDIEDELPFDVDADVIELDDKDYAIWYRDMGEDVEKYNGKTIKFKGIIARDGQLNQNSAIIGRHVMTCCADDITFAGLVCKFKKAVTLNTGDWILLTAKIKIEHHPLYNRVGPVLYAESTAFAVKPNPELATFY